MTPSTAQTAKATILDETDESEQETQAAIMLPLQPTAHGATATGTNTTTWSYEGPLPSTADSRDARMTIDHQTSVALTNTSGGEPVGTSHSADAGQRSQHQTECSSERGTTTPQQPAALDPAVPNTDTTANATVVHNQICNRVDPERNTDPELPEDATAPTATMLERDDQGQRRRTRTAGAKQGTAPTTKPRRERRVQDRPASTVQASSGQTTGEAARPERTGPREGELPSQNQLQWPRLVASTRSERQRRQMDVCGQAHVMEKKCACGGSLDHRTIGRAERCRECGIPFRQRGAYRCDRDPAHAYCKECAADTPTPAGRTEPDTRTQRTRAGTDATRGTTARGRGRTATEPTTQRRTAAASSQLARRNTNGEGGTSRHWHSQHTPTQRGPAMTQPLDTSDPRIPRHTDDGMECGGEEMPPTDQCQTCSWVWPSNPHTSGTPCPACGTIMTTIAPTDLTHALQLLPTKCPFNTAAWLPRAARNYAAVTLTWLLQHAAEQLSADDEEARRAQLLLYHFPALTMRVQGPPTDETGNDARGASTQAHHNRRLAKAAQGEWNELLREYIADLITLDPRTAHTQTSAQTHQAPEPDQPADQRTLERAARRAREGAIVAAAAALIGGPRVAPSRAVTEQIRSQFITSTTPSHDEDARHVMSRIKVRTSPGLVIARPLTLDFIARLRPLAGPGPSGWRNSYIGAIANHREARLTGIEAIIHWATAWAAGRATSWATELWTRSLARRFYKENRRAVRPIICAEHLHKLAGGLIFRAARQELTRACGQRQFEYSRPGGAPREASEAQAAINCNPDWPILTIDVKNAFGSVAWTDAAEIMHQKAPSTAVFLATQWQNGSTTLLIEDKPGVWEAFYREATTATPHFASPSGTTFSVPWAISSRTLGSDYGSMSMTSSSKPPRLHGPTFGWA